MGDKQLLVESYEINLELTESKTGGGFVARGEFARVDFPTGNKRVYPSKIYETEIKRLGKDMGSRKVYGELDHPNDGKTKLSRVSHLVTNLYKEGDRVIGEAEILDTENGKTLKTIIKSGGKVGISSRGFGSVKEDNNGNMIVQDDFKLMTFDFVATPADETAYPVYSKEDVDIVPEEEIIDAIESEEVPEDLELVSEEIEEDEELDIEIEEDEDEDEDDFEIEEEDDDFEIDDEDLDIPFREKLKEIVAKEIVDKVTEQREFVKEEIINELDIKNSTKVFSEVKELIRPFLMESDIQVIIDDKDTMIESLNNKIYEYKETLEELSKLSKKASYELFIEKKLGNDSRKAIVKGLIDDFATFDNLQELEVKIDTMLEGIPEGRNESIESEELQQEVLDLETKLEKKNEDNEKLSDENKDLKASLEESIDLAKEFGLRAYTEEKLNGHSDRLRLRNIIKKSNVDTVEQVDDLIESYTVDVNEGASMVEKIKEHVESQANSISESEGAPSNGQINGEVLGTSYSELRELAGLKKNQKNS